MNTLADYTKAMLNRIIDDIIYKLANYNANNEN